MIRRLERRLGALELDARVVKAPAEALPFADDSFDVAVSTLVLCSVDDPPQALRELRRVLRPGGQLLFMEHVRSEEPRLARLQDRMNRLNNIVAHCDCNRPTLVAMQGAGFSIRTVEHGTIAKAPPFVRPLVVGVADA
jgi:SAM-dependent methyltransferase